MTALAASSDTERRLDVQLLRMFEFLDVNGAQGITSEVEIGLSNGQYMTVAAGGKKTNSSPDRPPFLTYEVTLDHEAPRFWRRYTDDVGLLFAHVPRLLITHHVIRHGGLNWYQWQEPPAPVPPSRQWTATACVPWYM